ncbi:peptidase [Niastella yeongjuensis]|uniref:Peptidase n=1 Tax=Niastella yeongjuensis TaxID=354355 RepID=A0A1V9EYC2_9BACT|nr:slipin family protein [Niastella yeongjuensis]OQP51151.1 peptidase [Niastella yeongjuensis]SEN17205.1 SPFH domain / Band 7 family protein [Niastella yeongjuensis]
MKTIRVNAYEVALVFKKGAYQRILKEGKYWFWGNETVKIYNVTQPFNAPVELNILLQDTDLADALHVVDVKDNEIVLHYENGLLKQVLTAGRYTFWKSVIQYDFVRADISKVEITENIDRATLQHRLLTSYVRSYSIDSFEQGVLFIDGKFVQTLTSGVYFWWKNGISIIVGKQDMRKQQVEVNGQEILTKDKAALRINAWAQYKVNDIEKSLVQNKDFSNQLYAIFQLALREYIGAMPFDELLEKKESITPYILETVKAKTEALGVEVVGFGIRDIILPGDVKEIMNQVLIAEKKAQANTIMRREETASTRSLLNTAKLMDENAMLWKLKEMEYVEKIAEKISSISVNGNGVLIDQLKQILVSQK